MPILSLIQSVALVGGTVHPMTHGVEPAVATVLVEDGRITGVGPELELPEGVQVLDVRGLHVVPGLLDGSAHHDPEHDLLYLMAGVTTVRDAGNDLRAVLLQARPAARELHPGPNLLVAGQALDGPQGSLTGSLSLGTPTDVAQKLGLLFQEVGELDQVLRDGGEVGCGLDWLCFQPGLPLPAWRATLKLAGEQGVPVWGPRLAGVSLQESAQAGQAGFVGLQSLLPDGGRLDLLDPDALGPMVEEALRAGRPVLPMLGVWSRMLAERSPDLPELALLSPHYEVAWRDQVEAWRRDLDPRNPNGEGARAAVAAGLRHQQELLLALHRAGVPLVPGTGAPNPWLLPGRSLVEELELWAAAGIPPGEVLRLATAGAAEALGVADRVGRVEVGLSADLLVLGADPRRSASALRGPEIVLVRGRVLELPDLEDGLAALAQHQAEVRAEYTRPLEVAPPDLPEGRLVLSGALEYQAHSVRLSAERWAVVDCPDGRRALCARIRTQRSAGGGSRELQVVQYLKNGTLESFDVEVRDWIEPGEEDDSEVAHPAEVAPGEEQGAAAVVEKTFSVRGRSIGTSGILNIERRMDGIFVDNRRAQQAVAALDVSQGLFAFLVGHHFPAGESFVLSLEGPTLEPAVDRWEMRVQETTGMLQLLHSRGWALVGLGPQGHPNFLQRRTGQALTGAVPDPSQDGGALPPKAGRVLRPEDATPVEAGSGGR